jgi:uncharacterized protein (DUF305 family)
MTTFARSGAAALAAALTFTLAACSGTSSTATSTSAAASSTTSAAGGSAASPPSAMMSSPMMSGSASAMMSPPAASAEHNAADVAFAQQMIVHHQGAVEMADLAPSRAANQDVMDLAAGIKAAQAPEIEQMTGWLALWGAAMASTSAATTDDGMGGMDHGGMSGMGTSGPMSAGGDSGMAMPGMMSDAQMQELTDATGADFDRLFLQLMIVHHQGAIEMSDTEIAQGSNPAALALAEAIKTSQTAEITEMQQLLDTL